MINLLTAQKFFTDTFGGICFIMILMTDMLFFQMSIKQ